MRKMPTVWLCHDLKNVLCSFLFHVNLTFHDNPFSYIKFGSLVSHSFYVVSIYYFTHKIIRWRTFSRVWYLHIAGRPPVNFYKLWMSRSNHLWDVSILVQSVYGFLANPFASIHSDGKISLWPVHLLKE